MVRNGGCVHAAKGARDEVSPAVAARPLASRGMFNWSSSIGKVLMGRIRADNARHERVTLERLHVSRFCSDVVVPVMQDLGREFECHGRGIDIRREGNFVSFTVCHQGRMEFRYAVLASRRRLAGKSAGMYRDRAGYGRDVDRVYSLRDVRRLGPKAVARHIVAGYKRMLASARATM
jgi:hypothetical protein